MKKIIFILQIILFLSFSWAYITDKHLLFLFLLIPVHFFHICVLLSDFRTSNDEELTIWQKSYLIALMGAGMSSFTPAWDICFGLVAVFVAFLSARELYLSKKHN